MSVATKVALELMEELEAAQGLEASVDMVGNAMNATGAVAERLIVLAATERQVLQEMQELLVPWELQADEAVTAWSSYMMLCHHPYQSIIPWPCLRSNQVQR